MKTFFVRWEIDIDADNSIEAAKQALYIQRDKGSTSTVFQITDKITGMEEIIDLDALIECDINEPVFSENYPITFEDKGLRDFIQENFKEYLKNIVLTDEELDQFKRHLEASLSDWISENWRDFTENRGD